MMVPHPADFSGDDAEERQERDKRAVMDVVLRCTGGRTEALSQALSLEASLAADDLLMIIRAGGSQRDIADYLLYQGLEMLGGHRPKSVEEIMPLVQQLLKLFGRPTSF